MKGWTPISESLHFQCEMGRIAHVVQTALECTSLRGPVLLFQFVLFDPLLT